ncbi:hypothetical protein [uncultured Cohaesibacter sp.]|uniref:hypothetical protein n=1 Tax=uncultured Cohaesibacter sp. TaxID=1002546 RepID=UPI00292FE648|nr:hypothetical protein [uncultured Cohaesibacter sp.]
MKKSTFLIGVFAASMASSALAADMGSNGGHALPLGVAAQANLGSAGLLTPYNSDEEMGNVQSRMGLSRDRIGAATGGGPTSGYKDSTFAVIIPLGAKVALSENSYLNFSASGTYTDGQPNHVVEDGFISKAEVEYMFFPNPDTLLSASLFVEKTALDLNDDEAVIQRDGIGGRVDVVHKFSDHWGIAARMQYSFGESTFKHVLPFATVNHEQGDDRFYTQVDLVGQYRSKDLGIVPEGWVLHPDVGGLFQRNTLEATADSLGVVSSGVKGDTEDYSEVWAKLTLAKDAGPNTLIPSLTLGIEHELVDDLEDYLDESTFAIAGAGLSYQTFKGNRFDLLYSVHHGVNGNEINQSVVGSVNLTF